MERALQVALEQWKNTPGRLPLIIQGARQVGKTYLMKWFGQHHFDALRILILTNVPN